MRFEWDGKRYFSWEIPSLRLGEEELLNSDAIGRQLGNADVYDGSEISLTSNKITGSRGFTDTITPGEKVKAHVGKGKERRIGADLRENHVEIDNHNTQGEVGNWENGRSDK